jgi:ABC-type oligopeptide transport system ATPase subunit
VEDENDQPERCRPVPSKNSIQAVLEVVLDISPGQVVGIVGSSGSGKSTLAKLIQRLYVPESGRVLIDGVDLSMVDLAWLRRQIGVVLQENVLFNCSVPAGQVRPFSAWFKKFDNMPPVTNPIWEYKVSEIRAVR